jgi:F-type H+-transporting ATPase subunit b
MDIIQQLGINSTAWVQLGFFLVSYIFLSQFLFKPYMRILELRKKNTVGNVDEASKLSTSTEALILEYQNKLQAHNQEAAKISEKIKLEGAQQEEKILSEARTRSTEIVEETRSKVTKDIGAARESLKSQVTQMSRNMASRVLGRELP